MPTPKKGEKREAFVRRCIPIVLDEGTAEDGSQAAAICHSMFDNRKNKMSDDDIRETAKAMVADESNKKFFSQN